MASPFEKPTIEDGKQRQGPAETGTGGAAKPSRLELRQFSKTHSPQERKQAAADIRENRRNYFARRESLHNELERLLEQAEEHRDQAGAVAERIETLRVERENKTAGLLSRLWHRRRLKGLESELAGTQYDAQRLENEYKWTQFLIAEAERSLADKRELAEARRRLAAFYAGQEQAWGRYQEEERIRDVKEVIRRHNQFFVHGLLPYAVPEENSPLHENVDWKTKLKIALALEPALATSTIGRGDGPRQLWSRIGLLINGGRVEAADYTDSASKVHGFGMRIRQIRFIGRPEDIKGQITEALRFKGTIQGRARYNELVVSSPEYAGFYYCTDPFSPNDATSSLYPPLAEIAATCRELGLPLYKLEAGRLYRAEFDEASQELIAREEVPPSKIPDLKLDLPEETRRRLQKEILEDSPFRLYFPELDMVEARAAGVAQYLTLIPRRDRPEAFRDIQRKRKNTEPLLIARYPAVGAVREFLLQSDGEITESRTERHRKEHRFAPPGPPHTRTHSEDQLKGFSGYLSGTYIERLDQRKKIRSHADYLRNIERELEEVVREVEKIEKQNGKTDNQVSFYKRVLARLVFHLHGFAEQAAALGDEKAKEAALAIADRYIPPARRAEILAKRVDEEGRVKLTEEEIARWRNAKSN